MLQHFKLLFRSYYFKIEFFFCIEARVWKAEGGCAEAGNAFLSDSLIVVSASSQLWRNTSCLFGFFFLADDAQEAVKIGVNGILVSNHGARQLDGVPATVSTGASMLQ